MHERKFRIWNPFNGHMSYSGGYKNLEQFFNFYQSLVNGENNPKLMDWIAWQDKNEIDIYEGDFVNAHYFYFDGGGEAEGEMVGQVKMLPDLLSWAIWESDEHWRFFHETSHQESKEGIEIIRNIWQNPNLLEKSNG